MARGADRAKGYLLAIIAVVGYGIVFLATGRRFSFLYGLPGTCLILAGVFWFVRPAERGMRALAVAGCAIVALLWLVCFILELTFGETFTGG